MSAAPHVLCPFYVRHEGRELRCEGIPPSSRNIMRFPDKVYLAAYMARNCCEKYQSCKLYALLWAGYEEREDAK